MAQWPLVRVLALSCPRAVTPGIWVERHTCWGVQVPPLGVLFSAPHSQARHKVLSTPPTGLPENCEGYGGKDVTLDNGLDSTAFMGEQTPL